MKMKIDKQNGNICFNEDAHVYWNKDSGDKFISVTTLIGKYKQPYDAGFWSVYKAIERIMGEDFGSVKSELLKTKDVSGSKLEKMGLDLDRIKVTTIEVLQEWNAKKIESCERGNKIHKQKENLYTTKKECTMDHYGLGGKFTVRDKNFDLDIDKAVYPEYLVYGLFDFPEYGITLNLAGQSDLVIKNDNDLFIRDYKTNKKIDTKSYYNRKTRSYQTMLGPVNHIMDCHLMEYTLQLSMYAYMIKQLKPELNVAGLTLEHYDHNGNMTEYECDYLENEVKDIIKDYAKQQKIEIEKDKNKPVTFFLE